MWVLRVEGKLGVANEFEEETPCGVYGRGLNEVAAGVKKSSSWETIRRLGGLTGADEEGTASIDNMGGRRQREMYGRDRSQSKMASRRAWPCLFN